MPNTMLPRDHKHVMLLRLLAILGIAAIVLGFRVFYAHSIFLYYNCGGRRYSALQAKYFDPKQNDALPRAHHVFHCYLGQHYRNIGRSWRQHLVSLPPKGVIISAGSGYSIANAFVNIYNMRHQLRSTLPISIM